MQYLLQFFLQPQIRMLLLAIGNKHDQYKEFTCLEKESTLENVSKTIDLYELINTLDAMMRFRKSE